MEINESLVSQEQDAASTQNLSSPVGTSPQNAAADIEVEGLMVGYLPDLAN